MAAKITIPNKAGRYELGEFAIIVTAKQITLERGSDNLLPGTQAVQPWQQQYERMPGRPVAPVEDFRPLRGESMSDGTMSIFDSLATLYDRFQRRKR